MFSMKKIFLAISMIFAMTACIYEDIPQAAKVDSDTDVVVDFSIVVPEAQAATKSLDEPAVTCLTVVVFDENGFFVAAREAKQIGGEAWNSASVSNVNSNAAVSFRVSLPKSTAPRKLHFVANKAAEEFNYGMETDIMTSLVTSNRADAYWQTITVNNILDVKTMSTALTAIPMVRNYAKIVVNCTAANFTFEGFRVLNAPTSGTVVPYNVNTETFQTYWKTSEGTKVGRDYSELNTDQYHGFMPEGFAETAVQDLPSSSTWTITPVYTYERTYDSNAQKPLSILIKGIFNDDDDQSSYYKVDLYNGENYDVLRNIQYTINITEVLGDGYNSADEAAANAAGNNISESTSTNSLLNISDGNCRLFVEYVSKRVLSGVDFYLKYKFVPSIDAPTTYNNTIANTYGNTAAPSNTSPLTITCSTPEGSEGTVISSWVYDSAYGVDSEGWSRIKLTPKAGFTGQNWNEEIEITSTWKFSDNQTVMLSRKVNLYRVNSYTLSATCPASVPNRVGQEVVVNAVLPNNLPDDIFPLVFDIESSASSLYPKAGVTNVVDQVINMPVVTGASLDSNNPNNVFRFERTLTWQEYNALKQANQSTVSVPSYFLTNKAQSASTVYVYNNYFNLATCSFVTEEIDKIIPAGNITFNLHNNTSRDITVSNGETTITTLYNVSNGSTNSELNLGEVSDDQTITFRYYYTRYGISRTYYSASATVAQLKAEECTLTFTEEE